MGLLVTPDREVPYKSDNVLFMKKILLFSGVITLLLSTSGCLVTDGRGHGRYGHSEVGIVAPVVVVPAVRVRVD